MPKYQIIIPPKEDWARYVIEMRLFAIVYLRHLSELSTALCGVHETKGRLETEVHVHRVPVCVTRHLSQATLNNRDGAR